MSFPIALCWCGHGAYLGSFLWARLICLLHEMLGPWAIQTPVTVPKGVMSHQPTCMAKGLLVSGSLLCMHDCKTLVLPIRKDKLWEFEKDLNHKLNFFPSSLISQCCQKVVKDFSLFIGINLFSPPTDNCSLVKAVSLALIYLFSEYHLVLTEVIKSKIFSFCNGLIFSSWESSKSGPLGRKGKLPRTAAHAEASL